MSQDYRIKTQRQRGSAMVELALSVFVLFFILTGIIELSRVFFAADLVANAARAGAAYGLQSTSTATNYSGIQTAAVDDGGSGVSAAASQYCECGLGVMLNCTTGVCVSKRTYIKVTTTESFSSLATYSWIPSSFNLSSTAYMRVK
jgi:Flp pilus assembly protein TadG